MDTQFPFYSMVQCSAKQSFFVMGRVPYLTKQTETKIYSLERLFCSKLVTICVFPTYNIMYLFFVVMKHHAELGNLSERL